MKLNCCENKADSQTLASVDLHYRNSVLGNGMVNIEVWSPITNSNLRRVPLQSGLATWRSVCCFPALQVHFCN